MENGVTRNENVIKLTDESLRILVEFRNMCCEKKDGVFTFTQEKWDYFIKCKTYIGKELEIND